jgi:hypothetical protein
MFTPIYGFEYMEYGIIGWDGPLTTNFQRIETYLHTRRLVTFGESVDAYEAVYLKSDGKFWLAKADGSKQPCLGIAIESGIADEDKRIARKGPITNAAWSWTPGDRIYLSGAVAGALTAAAPGSNVQCIGIATSATTIFLEGNINVD